MRSFGCSRLGLMGTVALAAAVAAVALIAGLSRASAGPDDGWNPFRTNDGPVVRPRPAPGSPARGSPPLTAPEPPPMAPMGGVYSRNDPTRDAEPGFGAAYPGSEPLPGYGTPPPGPSRDAADNPPGRANPDVFSKIERLDLEPAVASDGSGLPVDAWRGLDIKTAEEMLATLTLPPRAGALQSLWQRLLGAAVEAPTGAASPAHFDAIRLEALYRSGMIDAMGTRLAGAAPDDPFMTAFTVRRELALGHRVEACQLAKGHLATAKSLPIALVSELRLLTGYCAAVAGDAGGAGVAAELARDEGVDAPLALGALDALAGSGKNADKNAGKNGLAVPERVHVLDYRLLELLGPVDPGQIIDKAEPALVTAMALDETSDPRTRVIAGEVAARWGTISTEQLRAIYEAAPAGAEEPALRRAELVRVIIAEPAAARKLQLMQSALDDGRKAGLLLPVGRVLAPLLSVALADPTLAGPALERGPAEMAIEILTIAGDYSRARQIVQAAQAWHWLPLLDIAEAAPNEGQRERNLGSLDALVQQGRLPQALLVRLATVLDATDVNVPIPLWEAAGRARQPNGYLPETGILPQLQEAAKRKEVARTILLAMRALGSVPADGAHVLALGDTIRALRRVGLDTDARRLGVEALLGEWPHG